MKSVAVHAPGKVGIVEVSRPEVGPYDALVRNRIGYICNATDRKVVNGHFPGIGTDQYPLLLGHESAGEVVSVGMKVTSFAVGDHVIGGLLLALQNDFKNAWGGDSEYVIARDHLAMVRDGVADEAHGWSEVTKIMRSVPKDIPLEAAGLLCTWREVYSAFADFHLKPGDDLLIVGAGPVGLSFCRIARLLGLGWIGIVDSVSSKRTRAKELGADEAFLPGDEALSDLAARRGKSLDAVIDAVGNESIINSALPLLRLGGAVCVYGVLSVDSLRLEKSKGPYNFNLFMHQWPTRDAEAAAQEPLMEWIREGKLRQEDFKTGEFPLDKIVEALEASSHPDSIKTMIRF